MTKQNTPGHPGATPASNERSDADLARALVESLQQFVDDRPRLARLPDAERDRLIEVCGRLSRPTPAELHTYSKARRRTRRQGRREDQRLHDATLLDRTRVRVQRLDLVYPTPDPHEDPRDSDLAHALPGPKLVEARTCYICKKDYRDVHSFYDALCPECAEFNFLKRNQTADLTDRVAVLTGGRVKIGYQAGVKLLRAGARLIVTTRFPRDAATRYAAEKDFGQWQDRLDIYGLDLRHTPSVEGFLDYIRKRYDRLDFVLNNACQTVRRPPGFYAHLIRDEQLPYDQLHERTRRLLAGQEELAKHLALGPEPTASHARLDGGGTRPLVNSKNGGPTGLPGIARSASLSQIPLIAGDVDVGEHLFPVGRLDADLQQIDLRQINSWRLRLAEVPTVELLEVHLVNAVAPFIFNARLKELMLRHPGRDKHIVNVSAMEGQFYRAFKTDKHPHTNMAKASLNMMTRTSAPDYHADGIHMNSVDTGWITDEDPIHITIAKQQEHGFHPPLDHVDAAARICAPIFDGIRTGEHTWGQFLKDYKPTRW
ncbi:MAG: SDR family oxidoreductase [Planctomycetota bacterium]